MIFSLTAGTSGGPGSSSPVPTGGTVRGAGGSLVVAKFRRIFVLNLDMPNFSVNTRRLRFHHPPHGPHDLAELLIAAVLYEND